VSLEEIIAANLAQVRRRIAVAASAGGRDPAAIQLLAVSKTFGPDHVRAAAAAGQQEFGENKVQEALQKSAATADLSVRWHLIGHLQANKARRAAATFACLHSVDRLDLLQRLDRAAAERPDRPAILIQVDLGGEATKHGAPAAEVPMLVRAAAACRHLRLQGLMTLPPWDADPERARPYFRRLRQMRDDLLASGLDPALLGALSMGMSHDLEVAIQEGSTLVRVGTAIFGRRPKPAPATE
jgi:PLP dependent protein